MSPCIIHGQSNGNCWDFCGVATALWERAALRSSTYFIGRTRICFDKIDKNSIMQKSTKKKITTLLKV